MKHLRLFLALFTLLIGGASASAQGWIPQAPADGDFYLYNVGTGKYLSCGSEYWGTKACIDNGGLNFTLANNGSGAYTIYSTSTFSFGNPNSAQLQSSGYVDQNVTATTWTFSPVNGMENTYTMQNATGTYLCAPSDGTKSILLNETQPTDEFGYWKLINRTNLFPETASTVNPVDITCLIGDANFESCNDTMESFWTIVASNNNLVKGAGGSHVPNNALESWQSPFTLSQSITVPNGYYRLQAQAFIREYNETGLDYPVIYINDATKPFKKMVTATADLVDVENYFTNNTDGGYYTGWTDVVSVTDKKITIGARGTRSDTWCVWDNFQLQYLGPLDLTDFINGLAVAVSAAEATQGTIPTACYNEISAVVSQYNQTYDNEDDYTNAIQAINNAVAQYASPAIVAAYSNYITIRTAVLDIDNNIDLTQADNLANDGTDANLDDAIQAARDALMNYLPSSDGNIDLTAAMLTNPGFELGNVNGWTNSGSIEASAQGNKAFDNTQGNYYAERWHAAGTVNLNQTVSNLAAGVYEIGAYLYTDTNDGQLYANTSNTSFSTSGWYTVQVAVDANGSIRFGASCTLTNSTWICMDGFSLKYIGGLPDLTAVEGKMNNEVASAQSSAIETYNANRTTANYNAAVAAIAAAQASVNAYVKAKTAIDKANAIKENHNLATADAAATFAEAIANIENPYNEGTLTDDAANNAGITLGTAVSNWHANNDASAVVYLRNGYALGDFEPDPTLHVNTWSTEGDGDGSQFSVPFYESWTADPNNLPESTITGSLTELPTGLYKVTAWVRVRAKNGVNATEATGITLDVNGGTAVDVTEGTQVGTSQFALDTYEAEGLVKDGNLYVNFNIAADNNISWLSFQNVKYEKVRDLTEEEMAIVPTAISLDETATIYKGQTLQLNPVFTPEDATPTVTWTSSDETVATVSAEGIVTGVNYGTASITITSTLNPEATATIVITVTAPLITEAENLGFEEGPVIDNHICTYAADMTKPENNTTFCRTQPVNSWIITSTDTDGKAAGIMIYGSSTGMGNNSIFAPSTDPEGLASGNVFGMVGVWTGSIQYIQNVKIPAGVYTITIPVYRNGGSEALTKNLIGVILDDGTEYLASTKTYSANTWTTETINFTVAEDTYGKLSLGLNAPNKGSNDSQRLWIDNINISCEPFATAEEIAALNEAISTAEGKPLGFEAGEYAPYNNKEALQALEEAKALDTNNPIAQSKVTAATTALTSATWTPNTEEVNAFFDGAFASEYSHSSNVMPIGWHGVGNLDNATNVRLMWDYEHNPGLNATSSKQGAFIKFTGIYGNETGYTLPLKAGTYCLEFIYGGWNENAIRDIKIYNDVNEATILPSSITAKDNKAHTTVDSWSSYYGLVTIPEDGDYIFSFYRQSTTNQNQLTFSDISLFKAKPETVTIKTGFTGTTYSSEYPLDFSSADGLKAYIITGTADGKCITTEVTKVPAGTGVYVEGDPADYTVNVYDGSGYSDVEGNLLVGTGAQSKELLSDASFTYYMFGKQNGKESFFKVGTETSRTASAHKAYLAIPGVSSAKAFVIVRPNDDVVSDDGGFADGINNVELDGSNAKIYNLNGQRVNNAKKGVYIQNGKKVIIK